MKIGVMVESFRNGLDGGLDAAARLGADGVQMYATSGATHPDALDADVRKTLLRRVRDMGLEFSAICADFGHGFGDASANVKLIEESKKVVDLTADLACKVVTTHIGVVPSEKSHPRYNIMLDACGALAQYGASKGVTFAVETGPEPATILGAFLDDVGIPKGLGVNFDPANLVMVCQENIPAAVERLGKYIVHTHAKDGVFIKQADVEQLYAGKLPWADYLKEMPLGAGHVPFPEYLESLKAVGYDGYLTIEREVGDDPSADITLAVDFLKKLLSSSNRKA